MSKRSHRKRVKGTPCSNQPKKTKQYTNNPRRKYAFERGNIL